MSSDELKNFKFNSVKHGSLVTFTIQYKIHLWESDKFQLEIDGVTKCLSVYSMINFKEFAQKVIQKGGHIVIKFINFTPTNTLYELIQLGDLNYDLMYNITWPSPDNGRKLISSTLNSISKDSHLQIHSTINQRGLFMLQTIHIHERYIITVWILFNENDFWVLLEDKVNTHILPCNYELNFRNTLIGNIPSEEIHWLPILYGQCVLIILYILVFGGQKQ